MSSNQETFQKIGFRPAFNQDYDFLYTLHIATMKDYVDKTWGWKDDFQEKIFKEKFEPDKLKIITFDKKDIGMIAVEDREEDIFLRIIEILPEYQNKGIGKYIVQSLIDKAKNENKLVFLYVLKVNPAQNLYKNLGFEIISEITTHYVMRTNYKNTDTLFF
ncbi:MAG: GNAT family N-acetyltransferase [Blastocatellia bacterium]